MHSQNRSRVIVGIHIRRGDKVGEVGRTSIPEPSFFRTAIRKYTRLFKSDTITLWFLIVSEDPMYWNSHIHLHEKHLIHVHNNISPQHDLALLAGCTHSVVSVGTFGWWGAYLANGRVIYNNEFIPTHELHRGGRVNVWDYYPLDWNKL
jgi:galactoside 2-L-fucosyltransferase 1/2